MVLSEINDVNIDNTDFSYINYTYLLKTITKKFIVNENDIIKHNILVRQIDKVLLELHNILCGTHLKQFVKKTKAPT